MHKGAGFSTHKEPAIVKAHGNPAIVAALDDFAEFTSQRHLGFPSESFSDQPNPVPDF